jgi:hypothetical protein
MNVGYDTRRALLVWAIAIFDAAIVDHRDIRLVCHLEI